MKRFTETEKWQDPWFRKLPGAHKLVFIFLAENCNNAGFYEFDMAHVAYLTGLEVKHVEGAMKGLARGIIEADGWVWVKNFLRHQKNDSLNPENAAHRQIIGLLKVQMERFGEDDEFKAKVAPWEGLLSPLGKGTGKGQVKDKGSPEGNIPTMAQALEYGEEIGMPKAEVEAWFDHFQSNGWKVSGKAPMKDWKAAQRNGNRRKDDFAPKNGSNGHTPPPSAKPAPADWSAFLESIKRPGEFTFDRAPTFLREDFWKFMKTRIPTTK